MPLNWRRFLLFIGLSIGVLLFLKQVWGSYEAMRQYQYVSLPSNYYLYLLAAVGVSALGYFLQMSAWIMIMRFLGISLTFHQTLQGYLFSFLPRYIPGSMWGYFSRSQWFEQYCGVDYATSGLGSILEALSLVLTALTLAGIYFCTILRELAQWALSGACAVLSLLTWLIIPMVVKRWNNKRVTLLTGRGGAQDNARKDIAPRAWFVAGTLYWLFWLTYGGSLLLISDAVLFAPVGNLLEVTFSSSLAWLLGFMVIIVPTGIGIREHALSALLTAYADFSPWQADLVAVISRFGLILAELGWLVVGFVFGLIDWRKTQGKDIFR